MCALSPSKMGAWTDIGKDGIYCIVVNTWCLSLTNIIRQELFRPCTDGSHGPSVQGPGQQSTWLAYSMGSVCIVGNPLFVGILRVSCIYNCMHEGCVQMSEEHTWRDVHLLNMGSQSMKRVWHSHLASSKAPGCCLYGTDFSVPCQREGI